MRVRIPRIVTAKLNAVLSRDQREAIAALRDSAGVSLLALVRAKSLVKAVEVDIWELSSTEIGDAEDLLPTLAPIMWIVLLPVLVHSNRYVKQLCWRNSKIPGQVAPIVFGIKTTGILHPCRW